MCLWWPIMCRMLISLCSISAHSWKALREMILTAYLLPSTLWTPFTTVANAPLLQRGHRDCCQAFAHQVDS